MDLGAGPPTTEGGARPRPFRGKVVARSSSSCAHDHDRLCIPPTSPAHKSEAGKKDSKDRHLNRRCRPSGTPSSISSCNQPLGDVRTAEAGSTRSSGVNKSAKVVLALLWQIWSERDSQISFSVTHGWSACGGPTMVGTTRDWEAELRGWLGPFLERLGHKARQRMCPLYIAGPIGAGDRKRVPA